MTTESDQDQEKLADFPGYEKDLIYGWVKDGAAGTVGMPLGVQLVGRPWREETVLRGMAELEEGIRRSKIEKEGKDAGGASTRISDKLDRSAKVSRMASRS